MEMILFVVAIAALLWAGVFVLRVPLPIACLIFLIASCCFGKYFFSAGLLTVDRLILILVVGGFVIRRGMNWHEPKPLSRADYLLFAFFGWLVVRTLTSDYMATAGGKDDITAPWHLIVGYITPLLIYWIARQGQLTESVINKLHIGLALFGVYLAFTGICEAIGASPLVFPRYIADPEIGVHFGRARGPMVQSARFGTYLIICLAALWVTFIWRNRSGRKGRILVAALLPLYVAVIALTYTRSVWIGTGLAALAIFALTLRGRWRPFVIGYMIAAAMVVAFVKRDSLVAFERDNRSARITRESTYMRAAFAYVSWQMFLERPLVGFGFNQFPIQSRNYLSDRSTEIDLESIRGYIHHNTYLSILVETGLVGFLMFLILVGGSIYYAWKLWSNTNAPSWARAHGLIHLAAMGPYVLQLAFRDVTYSPVENGIICLLAGITVGLRAKFAAPIPAAAPRLPAGWFNLANVNGASQTGKT